MNIRLCLLLVCIFISSGKAWSEYYRAQFLSPAEAQRKWGVKTFTSGEFRSGNLSQRAPMAVNVIKRGLFVGESLSSVRERFGDPDGYFYSDSILAYQIQAWTQSKREAWQLVFIPNSQMKVAEVKIQKKCCYEEPSWLKEK